MESCVLQLDSTVDMDEFTLCTLDFGAKYITFRIMTPDFLPTHPMEWDGYLPYKCIIFTSL